MRASRMEWIHAAYVEEGEFLMRNSRVFRVLKVEHPHAVVSAFTGGRFGPREIITLEGEYFRPSRAFLEEGGVVYPGACDELMEVVLEFGTRDAPSRDIRSHGTDAAPARLAPASDSFAEPEDDASDEDLGELDGLGEEGELAVFLPFELFCESLDAIDFRAFEPDEELEEIDRLEEFASRERIDG
ncbi:MAG TPA: hypothetical protein VK116_19865 [Planctomycetota bacterium]|nr:hypothetical protein [Planctomycetota bacterium]